jgi:hypothetical protein
METLQVRVQKQIGALIMELHGKDIEIEQLQAHIKELEEKANGARSTKR